MQSIGSGLSVAEIFSGKTALPVREAAVAVESNEALPTDQAQISTPEPSVSRSKSKKKSHKSEQTSSQSAVVQNAAPATPAVADGLAPAPSSYAIIQGVFAGVNEMPGLTAEQKLAQSQHILEKIFGNGAAPQPPAGGSADTVAPPTGETPAPPANTPPTGETPAPGGPKEQTPEEAQAEYEATMKIYNDIWAARRQNQVDCLKIFQDSMAEINKINSNSWAYVAKRSQENIDTFNGYLGWDGIPRR